jgi:glycosyltransferase involved in cell wall biosynthesis
VVRDAAPAIVAGVAVHRVFVDVARMPSRLAAGLKLARRFLALAGGVDIVHFHGFSQKTIGLMALATLRRRRRVLKLTSLGHDDPGGIAARGPLAAWAYRRAHVYIGVSPAQRQRYVEAGLPPERFALIANGVDVARFRPLSARERGAARIELGLPADLPLVLFVGFFSREKQPDVLFEAWRSLGGRPPSTLVYVGATRGPYYEIDPALADGIRAQAAAAGIEKRLHFAGETQAIERYYRAADVFVLPSSREGLPNALLEAMASGLACIASRLPDVTDHLVHDGENGVLVAPGDAAAIAAALRRLLEDSALAQRLGRTARTTIESGYTLETTAAQHLEIYHALLAGRAR